MAARGRDYFSLYVYMENFKNLLKINRWPDFKIISQECFVGDPLSDSFKKSGCVQNSGCHGNRKIKLLKSSSFHYIWLYRIIWKCLLARLQNNGKICSLGPYIHFILEFKKINLNFKKKYYFLLLFFFVIFFYFSFLVLFGFLSKKIKKIIGYLLTYFPIFKAKAGNLDHAYSFEKNYQCCLWKTFTVTFWPLKLRQFKSGP